jgi:hypothetical protein
LKEQIRSPTPAIISAYCRPALLAVDVKRESPQAGPFQLHQQLPIERQAIRVEDRLDAALRNHGDDVWDLRVSQRIPAGDGDAIGGSKAGEEIQLPADILERLVALGIVRPVASEAGQIAGCRRLQPGYRVVRQTPGQPVQLPMIQFHGVRLLWP